MSIFREEACVSSENRIQEFSSPYGQLILSEVCRN